MGARGWEIVGGSSSFVLNQLNKFRFSRVVELLEAGVRAGVVLGGIVDGLEGSDEDRVRRYLRGVDGVDIGRLAWCLGSIGGERGGRGVWDLILERVNGVGGEDGVAVVGEDAVKVLWGLSLTEGIGSYRELVDVLVEGLEGLELEDWEGEGQAEAKRMLSDVLRVLEWEGGDGDGDGMQERIRRLAGEMEEEAQIVSLPRGIYDVNLKMDPSPEYEKFLRRGGGRRKRNEIAVALRELGLDVEADYRIVERGGLNVCEDEEDMLYCDAVHRTAKKIAFLRRGGKLRVIGGKGGGIVSGGMGGRDEWKKRALEDGGYEVVVVGGGSGGGDLKGKLKEKMRVEVGVDVDSGIGGIIRRLI